LSKKYIINPKQTLNYIKESDSYTLLFIKTGSEKNVKEFGPLVAFTVNIIFAIHTLHFQSLLKIFKCSSFDCD